MVAIALVVAWVARVAGEEDAPLSCPCGLGDKAWPTGAAGSLEDLKWLHIPKAGSSWAVNQESASMIATRGSVSITSRALPRVPRELTAR